MKGRLNQSSLAHVIRLFAGQEPISQNKFRALHHNAAVQHGCVADQDFLHHFGMIELKDVASEGFVVDDIPVDLRIPQKEIMRAGSQQAWIAQSAPVAWAGWILRAGGRSHGKKNALSSPVVKDCLLLKAASD